MAKRIIGNLVGTTIPQAKVDKNLNINSHNAIANSTVTDYILFLENQFETQAGFNENFEEQISEHEDRITALETTITEHENVETCIQEINNNTIHSCIVVSKKIGITFDHMEIGFTAAMHFSTPSVIPTDYSDFPDDVEFLGDSVTDGKIVPEANMRYSIVFYCDGVKLCGYVSGVSI